MTALILDTDIHPLIISFLGALLLILLSIIGFFLSKLYSEFKEMNLSLHEIKETVGNNVGDVSNIKLNCNDKHQDIHEKLSILDKKTFDHERRITKLED